MRLAQLFLLASLAACSAPAPPSASQAAPPKAVAPEPVVTSIEIVDEWGGLGQRSEVQVRLVPVAGGFRREGLLRTFQKEEALAPADVPAAAVTALVAVASAPPLPRERLLAQLTDQETLTRQAPAAFAYLNAFENEPCGPAAKSLFVGRYENAAGVRASLDRYFDSFHTDDYPRSEVAITFADGRTLVVGSESQSAWLVPWRTPAGASWDPGIARALAAVLPAQAPNVRAFGLSPESVVADAVHDDIDVDLWQGACR